jgi:hypothetical protein
MLSRSTYRQERVRDEDDTIPTAQNARRQVVEWRATSSQTSQGATSSPIIPLGRAGNDRALPTTRRHDEPNTTRGEIPETRREGTYLWTWYCCRARTGTTGYHHPGPYLVETTPACTECDHVRCGRCELR